MDPNTPQGQLIYFSLPYHLKLCIGETNHNSIANLTTGDYILPCGALYQSMGTIFLPSSIAIDYIYTHIYKHVTTCLWIYRVLKTGKDGSVPFGHSQIYGGILIDLFLSQSKAF